MLLIATAAWSFSFVWVNRATQALNAAAGLRDGAAFGPSLFTALRFAIAAFVWFAIFPNSRRRWTTRGHRGAALLGVLLGVAAVFQTIGLNLTTEPVSAFLTSLTVVFVPLMTAAIRRRLPTVGVLASVMLATSGVYLLTGASFRGFGRGEWLGLFCSILFGIHLIGLHHIGRDESPWRLAGGQFAWVAISVGVVALLSAPRAFEFAVLAQPVVWLNLLMTVVVCTLVSFGLMNVYQPHVDPTRATMIYLLEPIFASLVAWWLAGRTLTSAAIVGASLILLANVVAEREVVLWVRRRLLRR